MLSFLSKLHFFSGLILLLIKILIFSEYFRSFSGRLIMSSPANVGITLILLTLWSSIAAGIAIIANSKTSFFIEKSPLLTALAALLIGAFSTEHFLSFYLFFEASLIPILVFILGWGYQPERIAARLRMFFYTLVASLPLLLILLSYFKLGLTSPLEMLKPQVAFSRNLSIWLATCLVLGFLVKLPIFLGHLWLPRAHVEAPIEGSMLLASVILKLGGYGLVLVSPFVQRLFIFSNLILSLAMAGGGLISILCLSQLDVKVLIAYSSVAHIAIAASRILTQRFLGIWAGVLSLLAHGAVSSGIFIGANTLYQAGGSRNMLILKRVLRFNPIFCLFWFSAILGNIGGPPSPNLLSEIFIITALMQSNFLLAAPVILLTGLATVFRLILYMVPCHHHNKESSKESSVSSKAANLTWILHLTPVFLGVLWAIHIIYTNIILLSINLLYFSRFNFYHFCQSISQNLGISRKIKSFWVRVY